MKVFRLDSAQMRRLFKFFVLTLLFGLIQCQNSIQFNDKNNYDYEYGSNHLIDGYDEPKKIGELEFDVEVAEETPKPGENIPEIVVDNKDYFDDNNDDSQRWTELPVEMLNKSERVGDIMFHIEVADKEKINASFEEDMNRNRQAFPSDIVKNKKPKNFQSDVNVNISVTTGANMNATADSNSVIESSSSLNGDSSTGKITGSHEGASNDTTTESTPASLEPDKTPDTSSPLDVIVTKKDDDHQKPGDGGNKKESMWPIYLIATIFFCLAIVGIVWALFRLHLVSKAEVDLEKQVLDETAPVRPKGPALPTSTTSAPSPQPRPSDSTTASDSTSADEVNSIRSGLDSSKSETGDPNSVTARKS